LLAYLERTLKLADTVLDVGSLIGATCMISGKLAGKKGRVFAFEASNQPDLSRFVLDLLKNDP
jgi:hypothetical protein